MMITTIGIDLARAVFQLHGVDARGNAVLKKQLKRDQVLSFFANLPSCLIGMEACGSAHFWARKLQALGHTAGSWRRNSSSLMFSLRAPGWRCLLHGRPELLHL
jgi:hypothetical protein